MRYLCYPFKYMRITQGYGGKTSHAPHSQGVPKDYPIDEGGKDTGRDPMYAPCDLVVRRVYGVGNGGVNTLFVRSAEKVVTPKGCHYVCFQITHENDEDLRKYKAGDIIRYRSVICREGTDGASGNHIHLSVGFGEFKGNCWTKNSKGKYVINTTEGAVKPQEAFYIDKSFTTVKNAGGMKFEQLPFPLGTYKAEAGIYVRVGAGKKYARKTFIMFTEYARERIKQLNNGKAADGFVKGMEFTVSDVEYNAEDKLTWGKTLSGWVCLNKCKYEH